MNRVKELGDWLKTDTDKMFDQMANVDKITKECEQTVKIYTNIVNTLQSTEDRNDEFMQKLLQQTQDLKINKLNVEQYEKD